VSAGEVGVLHLEVVVLLELGGKPGYGLQRVLVHKHQVLPVVPDGDVGALIHAGDAAVVPVDSERDDGEGVLVELDGLAQRNVIVVEPLVLLHEDEAVGEHPEQLDVLGQVLQREQLLLVDVVDADEEGRGVLVRRHRPGTLRKR
jgi:hypothetical protein